MLTMYLCGALITAVAAIGGSLRFSDVRTPVTPMTRVLVAVVAGALWPVMAVGALLLVAVVPLLESLGTAADTRTNAGASKKTSTNADLPTEELVVTGS